MRRHWTERLREEMERVKKERDEYKDLYLRVLADHVNYKRRIESEWKRAVDYANERLVYELLPVLDNFERALEAMKGVQDVDSIKKGVEMIYKGFLEVLRREGLEPFDSVGERFDPRVHEAISVKETSDMEPGIVVEEFQRGYKFKDKLLRPAKVSVSKEPARAKEDPTKGGM